MLNRRRTDGADLDLRQRNRPTPRGVFLKSRSWSSRCDDPARVQRAADWHVQPQRRRDETFWKFTWPPKGGRNPPLNFQPSPPTGCDWYWPVTSALTSLLNLALPTALPACLNPEGIPSFSPGLQATLGRLQWNSLQPEGVASGAGFPLGLAPCDRCFNPFRVEDFFLHHPG